MKRCVVLFSVLVLSIALVTPTVVFSITSVNRLWALIVTGWQKENENMDLDPSYLKRVLSEHYSFSGINHLSGYPNNKQSVRNAITGWLREHSGSNDLVLIFIISHGGGFNSATGQIEGGRVDGSQGDQWMNLTELTNVLELKCMTVLLLSSIGTTKLNKT